MGQGKLKSMMYRACAGILFFYVVLSVGAFAGEFFLSPTGRAAWISGDWRESAYDFATLRAWPIGKDIVFVAAAIFGLTAAFLRDLVVDRLQQPPAGFRLNRGRRFATVEELPPVKEERALVLRIRCSERDGAAPCFETLDKFRERAAQLGARYHAEASFPLAHDGFFRFPADTDPSVLAALARDLKREADARGISLALAHKEGRFWKARDGAISGDCLLATESQWKQGKAMPAVTRDWDSALAAARRGDSKQLAYFRGDEELTQLLTSLGRNEDWEMEAFLAVIAGLKEFRAVGAGPSLVEAYRSLLRQEIVAKNSYRLSSVLGLAPYLLSAEQVDLDLERLFLHALAVSDRRVKSNGIEVFIRLFPEREFPELRAHLRDLDNRVSANALVKAALERFDDKVIRKIEERVRSGSVAHVASALYALGEIAAHYRRHDPHYLRSKVQFLQLFEEVPAWVQHPNPMVRRQALWAGRKLGSKELDERLRILFERAQDADQLLLFASVYGWKKAAREAA
jgi:hypothetical protein